MSRPTRMNKWKWLKWPHFLWHSGICPKDGKESECFESYVPKEEKVYRVFPKLMFFGKIVKGDKDGSTVSKDT